MKEKKLVVTLVAVAILGLMGVGIYFGLRYLRDAELDKTWNLMDTSSTEIDDDISEIGEVTDIAEEDLKEETPDYGEDINTAVADIDSKIESLDPEVDFADFDDITY